MSNLKEITVKLQQLSDEFEGTWGGLYHSDVVPAGDVSPEVAAHIEAQYDLKPGFIAAAKQAQKKAEALKVTISLEDWLEAE